MSDTTYTGVLDRFEAEEAVLLLEDDGDVIDQIVIPADQLPDEARHQNAVLTVTRDDHGDVVEITYQPERTAERTERAQSRFDRLSSRPPDGERGGGESDDGERGDDKAE